MRRALDAAADQGLGREVALLHSNLAEALWPIEGPRAWLEALREGGAFAERRGIEEFVLAFAAATVMSLVELGSLQEAMALAGGILPRLEAAEDAWHLLQVRSTQVRVLTRRGELAEAASLADWAVEKAREVAEPQILALAFPAAAALHRSHCGKPVRSSLGSARSRPSKRRTLCWSEPPRSAPEPINRLCSSRTCCITPGSA
jgi:hypothetical protein